MLIDTHAHLDYPEFAEDFAAMLERAREAGVTRAISIATGLESSRRVVALAEKYEEIYAVIGVHPNNVEEEADDFMVELRKILVENPIAAIGEIGLDYYRLPEDATVALAQKKRQAIFFRSQLDLAVATGMNVVIHQRAAWEDTVSILAEYTGKVRGVFHCFGESVERAREVIALGHLVSFTGIVTFKNGENVRAVARTLLPGQMMVETDCPYLAPVPYRGRRCEPAHTRLVAEAVALAREESIELLAAHTTQTAEMFFKLA